MDNLTIKLLKNHDQLPWNLLLLADPSRGVIEKYINKSQVYVAMHKKIIVGVYILMSISSDMVELKNIAVDKKYQGKRIGKKLILHAINKAKKLRAKEIIVGTGNSSLSQLSFYQKCGFRIKNIEKDFFTKNYPEEIIENGIKCKDKINLVFFVRQ